MLVLIAMIGCVYICNDCLIEIPFSVMCLVSLHRPMCVVPQKTSLWGSPEYTEGSMRHRMTCVESKYYLYDIVNVKLVEGSVRKMVAVVEGVLSD